MTIFNPPSFRSSHTKSKAFTLVEVLLATSLLVFMIAILGTVTGHISKIWTMVNAQNQRRATGRALLQFIARDIQSIRLPNPAHPADAANGRFQFIANPSGANYLYPHAFFWQAPVANNTTQGAIAEVGYFVKWNGTKASLCRFYADPTTKDKKSQDAFLIYSGNWLSNDEVADVAPATETDNYRGWLADNVIALFVRCVNESGTPIIQDSTNKYSFNSLSSYTDPTTGITYPAPVLPPAIEIAIVVVDANTAQRITAAPTTSNYTNPANFYTDIQSFVNGLPNAVKPGAEVFTTTVFLPLPAK